MSTAQMNLLISTNRIGTGLRANPVCGKTVTKKSVSQYPAGMGAFRHRLTRYAHRGVSWSPAATGYPSGSITDTTHQMVVTLITKTIGGLLLALAP
ncbi:hypothetical protein AN203_21895 [Escherichia coli]|nr:hypothetical protein AN203_21895 [Escherichia coli]